MIIKLEKIYYFLIIKIFYDRLMNIYILFEKYINDKHSINGL